MVFGGGIGDFSSVQKGESVLTDANEQWLFQTCNVLALRHLLFDLAVYLLSAFSTLLIFVDFLRRWYCISVGFGNIPGDQFFDGLPSALGNRQVALGMIRLMLLGKGSVTAFARKVIVHMHASLHKIVATR